MGPLWDTLDNGHNSRENNDRDNDTVAEMLHSVNIHHNEMFVLLINLHAKLLKWSLFFKIYFRLLTFYNLKNHIFYDQLTGKECGV